MSNLSSTRHKVSTLFYLVILQCLLVAGLPYQEEDDLYDYSSEEDIGKANNEIGKTKEKEVKGTPSFLSPPVTVLVNEGETIRLPCMVDRLEGFVMLWKRNKEIITVASQIIDKTVRLEEKENGNVLIISQASPAEEAEYTCEISAYNPTQLTHNVKIRIKPEIEISPKESLTVKTGDSVKLSCSVLAGNPMPELRWKRIGEKMPSGEEEIFGDEITFESVTRHHAGHYECQADNGYGPTPVAKEVILHVKYSPFIEEEEKHIETSQGESEEIICTVHADPKAIVTWSKDGSDLIGNTSHLIIVQSESTNSLTFPNMTVDMLGEYRCDAVNEIGKDSRMFTISGLALQNEMLSSNESEASDHHSLQWKVKSKSPVSEFKVLVREEGDGNETVHEVETNQSENGTNESYVGLLELTNLLPDATYLVQVSSSNSFGYNEWGEVSTFKTKIQEPVLKQSIISSGIAHSTLSGQLLASLLFLHQLILK